MCRTQLKSSASIEESKHAAEGINTGILYLMFIPYAAVALLAYVWYRDARRSER